MVTRCDHPHECVRPTRYPTDTRSTARPRPRSATTASTTVPTGDGHVLPAARRGLPGVRSRRGRFRGHRDRVRPDVSGLNRRRLRAPEPRRRRDRRSPGDAPLWAAYRNIAAPSPITARWPIEAENSCARRSLTTARSVLARPRTDRSRPAVHRAVTSPRGRRGRHAARRDLPGHRAASANAASTTLLSVGWAWIVSATSSTVSPVRIATTASWSSVDASYPNA